MSPRLATNATSDQLVVQLICQALRIAPVGQENPFQEPVAVGEYQVISHDGQTGNWASDKLGTVFVIRDIDGVITCSPVVCPESIGLDELSMGMSGDYEIAIEEGATLVRIGSALFEGIARD